MKLPNQFEVKPKTQQNAILLGVGCTIFSVTSLFMLKSGEPKTMLGGLLGLIFFGGLGIFFIPKLLQRPVSMILNRESLIQITPYGKGKIYWSEVEKIGVAQLCGNQMVGIRLKKYDNYINNLSPEFIEFTLNSLPYLKILVLGTSLLKVPSYMKLWSELEGRPDPIKVLKNFGKIGNLVELMLWNRQLLQYDICFTWSDLDRPASEFVKLLEQYRNLSRF